MPGNAELLSQSTVHALPVAVIGSEVVVRVAAAVLIELIRISADAGVTGAPVLSRNVIVNVTTFPRVTETTFMTTPAR